jgi:hypothetical protein
MTPETAHLHAISNDRIPLCRTGMAPLKVDQAGLSEQVQEFFRGLFSTSEWPARWYCGSWSDFHGWLYIISDILIWTAYFLIPIFLIRFILSRKDFPFPKTIWLFVAFILFLRRHASDRRPHLLAACVPFQCAGQVRDRRHIAGNRLLFIQNFPQCAIAQIRV